MRSEYIARINRVLDHIHANLDQTLTLDELAQVAGFSPFHFHRLFKSLVGETISEYILRSRLERAANSLLYMPEQSILSISVACGFSSPAVFSRAFKERFSFTPSQYRKAGKTLRKPDQMVRNGDQEMPTQERYTGAQSHSFNPERKLPPMEIKIVTLPAFHVAYIRHLTGYEKGKHSSTIGAAFQRVCAWAAARDLFRPNTLTIGIPYDNPDITPSERCRYDACVTIPEDVTAGSGEVGVMDISGGKYAVCHIEVPVEETRQIGEMVDRMYCEWLPDSSCTVDEKPALEIYHAPTGKPQGTWISMDYCIPIKPL
ncbi:MAG: AraC family transcriptional regulator [Anaerolineae bacterium]|nr:AraC family transcriptional regulator [Anaerolineae bacterium]